MVVIRDLTACTFVAEVGHPGCRCLRGFAAMWMVMIRDVPLGCLRCVFAALWVVMIREVPVWCLLRDLTIRCLRVEYALPSSDGTSNACHSQCESDTWYSVLVWTDSVVIMRLMY